MVEAALFSLEEVGMRVQIPGRQPPFFFFFHRFFTLWLFTFTLLTAEPFSFARSLRKRISSSSYSIVEVVEVVVVVVV